MRLKTRVKLFFVSTLVLLAAPCTAFSDDLTLQSPDGTIEIRVSIDPVLAYSVFVDGRSVVAPSRLALEIDGHGVAGDDPQVTSENRASVDRVIEPVVAVKSAEIQETFSSLSLSFEDGYGVEFRAYDNGVAYRFITRIEGEIVIRSEVAELNPTNATTIYFPEEDGFKSHNERTYIVSDAGDLGADRLASLPVLYEADELRLLFSETDLQDYPGMWMRSNTGGGLTATFPPYPAKVELRENSDRNEYVIDAESYIARSNGNRTFPWRFVAIERSDAGLLTNQLSYLLAEPNRLEDTSWISPGNVAWDWWNYNNVSGVDFRAGVNTKTYKYYIDFASTFGIDYVILDEGWYELGDILDVVPEIDIEELVAYGKEKGVGVVLWVIWKTLDDQMAEAMAQFEVWGVTGLKIDFMARDDQPMVEFYWRAAEEAAKRKLLVNFHGAYKPAGLRRTFPNVLTREGVKGLEHNKWGEAITPTHNLTIPFIRMVAGPMDYTPGAMVNAQPENFRSVFNRPMSMGTRAHQMAMYVVYESPMQMLADTPTHYLQEPEITQFIANVPTTWDETRVIEAAIGESILVARRSGNNWYVAAMTNEEPRSYLVDTGFLGDGSYTVDAFVDGINADRYASDVRRYAGSITAGTPIQVELAPGGGWAAHLSPANDSKKKGVTPGAE